MAIHHTRLKKAIALIGEEKEVPKIILMLSQAEYTDEEIQEILQKTTGTSSSSEADNESADIDAENPVTVKLDGVVVAGQAKSSKYADFDVFMGKAITKEYRHISGEMRNYISHFQLSEKVQTVRIEPALAKDFNRFAVGFIDNPGKMYFPKGTKQVGDIQTYQDATYKPMNETTVTNEFMD